MPKVVKKFLEKNIDDVVLGFYNTISEPMYIFADIKKLLGITDITIRFTSKLNFNADGNDTTTVYIEDKNSPVVLITNYGLQRLFVHVRSKLSLRLKIFINDALENYSSEKVIKVQIRNIPKTEGFKSERGIIYINEDTDKPGHLKIGLTTGKCEKRLSQLNCGSSTNSIVNLKIFETDDVFRAETVIHRIMKPYRIVNQKEWFYIPDASLKERLYTVVSNTIEFLDLFENDPLK